MTSVLTLEIATIACFQPVGLRGEEVTNTRVDGKVIAILGDVDGDGILSSSDIDLLSAGVLTPTGDLGFDINGDGLVNLADHRHWIKDSSYANIYHHWSMPTNAP